MYLSSMRKLIFVFYLLFSLGTTAVEAQTVRVDRARKIVYNSSGKEKYNALIFLFEQRYSMSIDSLNKYLRIAYEVCGDTASVETLLLFEHVKLVVDGRTMAPEDMIHRVDSLVAFISGKGLVTDYEIKFLHAKAGYLVRIGKYKEGLELYYEVLRLSEKRKNQEYVCAAWNGIGWVHMETAKYEEAITYFRKVMGLLNDTIYNGRPNVIYSNLASCYCTIGQNDSALKYILKVEKNVREVESLQLLANALAIKSDIMKAMGRTEEVAVCLKEMVEIRRKIGDVFYIISDMFVLAQYYAENDQCDKGIEVCYEALALIDKYNIRVKEMIIREALALNYRACGDYKKYADELQLLMNLKDSINKVASTEALAEVESKYELQKKEEQIEKQQLMITNRNYLMFGSFALLLMALFIGFQYFRNYKRQSSIQGLLAVSEAREEERTRIAAELHDNIGTQLGFISRKIDMFKNKSSAELGADVRVLEEISNASRRTIGDLRETIWALKKEQVDFRELADRLKLLARRQFEGLNDVRVNSSEILNSSVVLSPLDSLNVFRIIQEAVYNAFAHASATEINLSFFTGESGDWKISVMDNGTGFDVDKQYENHYGLENMRQRAKESALKVVIESGNKGTVITLQGKAVK
jgi:signal transduction histidine kinase